MKKVKEIGSIKITAISLLIMGGILLGYVFLQGSTSASIPGWSPVNEPLEDAIDDLTATRSSTTEPIAGSTNDSPSDTPLPSGRTESTADVSRETGVTPITTESPASSADLSPPPPHSVAAQPEIPSSGLIDLNQAIQSQLETLPGIGPSKAKAIITYREQHGGFQNIDQLLEVKGIGPKVYEKISDLVDVSTRK
ncbi:ComEA family DNA-binding protein [Cohnella herbarum]|uniref:Helix-hairpin-helix DNA-binding motif class 1 domain-containing protein n=1 Tax=Cohnella herbarum TaxID=2728023 RepID=A0A7Z2VIN0_9BACL|nr:helix-hairpin-helix domain-containing protein [Cohnella herbarum]QJD83686.1 hypothetical protein HH215_11190 [Cohnella herbarum]